MDKRMILKRIGAYIIDFSIITIIVMGLSNSKINPNLQKYNQYYDNYSSEYEEYVGFSTELKDIDKDNKITSESYEKIASSYPSYGKFIDESLIDKDLKDKDIENISEKVNNEFTEKYKHSLYNIEKYSLFYNSLTIIVTILYCGVFPLFTDGQTLGKKIFKIRIVKTDNNNAKFINYFLRTIILYDVIFLLINIVLVNVLKYNTFYIANYVLSLLKSFVRWSIIIMILTRKDNTGLHDLIAKTKVIEVK